MTIAGLHAPTTGEGGAELVKVAVRDLVEFVLQAGDLGGGSFVGAGRAVAGTRGHQRIQKSRPADYEAEIAVAFRIVTPEVELEIKGRIDGVWRGSEPVFLEEIKTTTAPLDEITIANQPLHWGQARAYACIFARQNDLARIGVQLTYLQLDTLETLELRQEYGIAELEVFFDDLVSRYLAWARTMKDWRSVRDASITALAFPFTGYRAGQRAFAVGVYRAIADGVNLFAQAPTGIGKTVATLFPALKALGGGLVAKIFYLTAKTVGRNVAEETVKKLAGNGLRCKVLTLTAKEKICFLDTPDCRPEACEYARGYFDRVKDALETIFTCDTFDRPAVEEVARSHRVCPFEFSLFLSLWSDVIIGDFNYAFDPRVYLRRFFDPPQDEYAFLVDEAHNLPDRAREMFSADLRKSWFADLKKTAKTAYPAVSGALAKITPYFTRSARAIREGMSAEGHSALVGTEVPDDLIQALRRFLKSAEAVLARTDPTRRMLCPDGAVESDSSEARAALLEVFFRATAFVRVAESFDEHFVCYTETEGRDVRIKLFCLDPSDLLAAALERARSTVFFSATLLPMGYFFDILGGRKDGAAPDRTLRLSSPFDAAHLGLMVLPQIRTEFRVREQSLEALADVIRVTVSCRQGNYMVYFPSYKYMTAVREVFIAAYPEIRIIEQASGMTEEARDAFLKAFSADAPGTLVGFAVMGGIFGEGIDLRGERLIGSIIVGVGLPQICLERDLIRGFFERKAGTGFEFAYRYPGMNRVMQAAGRVIRTERDRGVVLLVDERFLRQGYRSLFPAEWSHAEPVRSAEALERSLSAFWSRFSD
ncbi:MAG TPA: ATP-dependent DNA helicase [Candidatus Ozemobacteraceae bacterium]|nr:ATP-dependent DNA helicase [Candidatus Ozemobacteraceae bacterium]